MLKFLVGCTHVGCYATDAAAADGLYDPDDAVMMMMMIIIMMMMLIMMMTVQTKQVVF